ncbi:MAG TPA: TonB family protein [Steroidobacteraceae bacterium]|jgi:protein TonB
MTTARELPLHHTSRRASAWFVIAAAHAALIYLVATNSMVRQMLDPPVIQASIIDQLPQTEAPPPLPPKLEFPDPPTIEPPEVNLVEDPPPAPAAITVSVNTNPPPPKVETGPRVISDVAYLDPPRPLYPAESRRSGEQGLVVLRVLVDESGHVAKIEVERSSGFARLDDAARKAVAEAQFRPYVENGVPRQALAVVPIEFTWKSHAASNSRRS